MQTHHVSFVLTCDRLLQPLHGSVFGRDEVQELTFECHIAAGPFESRDEAFTFLLAKALSALAQETAGAQLPLSSSGSADRPVDD